MRCRTRKKAYLYSDKWEIKESSNSLLFGKEFIEFVDYVSDGFPGLLSVK